MPTFSRRSFLQSTALASTAPLFALTGPTVQGQVAGANNRVRLALAGAGGRGNDIANNQFGKIDGVEIVAVVDADKTRADAGAARIKENFGNTPDAYQDYRKMLEDENIDGILVAPSNYWQALMTVWGCQAGKHIFVEKPGSYNIFESRQTANAAKKYGKVVQLGVQRRGMQSAPKIVAAVHSGKYGKLVAAKAYAHRPRNPLPVRPIDDPPAHIDWDLWLGPAAHLEYHRNLVHYNWHWFWETGNGEIGNNGVHYFDICLWALGERHPDSVVSFGARFVNDKANNYKDHAETPTIHFALYDFGGTPLIFESCNLAGPRERWTPLEDAEFVMEEGTIRGDSFTSKAGNRERVPNLPDPEPVGIFQNFVDAVRDPNTPLYSPIDKGMYAGSVCHWGNMAYRSGVPTDFKTCREKIGSNPVMQASIDKVFANLKDVFGDEINVETAIPWQCSDVMSIDAANDCFSDNTEANKMLRRVPREPFVVPEVV